MNESMEREAEDMGVVMTQTEQEVVAEPQTAAPIEEAEADGPFGSAAAVSEEEAVRNLAPILDLPDAETPEVMAEEPAEAVTPVEAPTEDYEVPRMSSPEVVAAAPVEAPTNTDGEYSVNEDPMFGPMKRLMADILGED